MFCSKCGQKIDISNVFCPICGQRTKSNNNSSNGNSDNSNNNNYYQTYQSAQYRGNTYGYHSKTPSEKLAEREQIAGIVWIVVAAIQGVTAISSFGALNWLSEILGIDMTIGAILSLAVAGLNGFGAYRAFKRVEKVRRKQPGIVAEYDNLLIMSIVFIAANVLLGSFIGIAGAIFDLCNRYYALNNANYLET